jgi:RHS repeat-associated protein
MSYNGEDYFYVYNLQGDVVGLLDSTGTEVVSYTYDTWGKEDTITGSLADTVGKKNPYRYRGYRYDSETGLYYLNSRYYNPEWGRMLNADSFGGFTGELLSHNVFAYVQNNPVMYEDPSGYYMVQVGYEGHLEYYDVVGIFNPFEPVIEAVKSITEAVILNDLKALFDGELNRDDAVAIVSNVPIGKVVKLSFMSIGVVIKSIKGTTKIGVMSSIKNDPRLVKAAEKMGKNKAVQQEADELVQKFLSGNTNPGLGSKNLFGNVSYLRGREGARVFYRMNNGKMEILGKSSKANEQIVINVLKELYGK